MGNILEIMILWFGARASGGAWSWPWGQPFFLICSLFFQISDVDIFVEDFEALSKEGDILLVMSNGDFSDLSNKVIERFKNES